MKKFSDIRKIKVLSNPIGKNKFSVHPITLTLIENNQDYKIVNSQFFIDDKQNISYLNKYDNQKISRSTSKNMDSPDLSLPLTDILNIYNIDNYDELISNIKKLKENETSEYTIFRIINIYVRVFFEDLKKNNNSLIKIFKILFEEVEENKTKTFLKKWFDNKKVDDFNLNICKEYKNFLSN
jgi:hypothetical protein